MRRIAAVAIAACMLAGPLAATEIEMKKKDEKAAKEKTEPAKAGQPTKKTTGKTAPANACADPKAAGAQASKVPQTGSAGFFQTVEDIYVFQGPVAELATPAAQAAPAAEPAKPKTDDKAKKDEPKKKD